MGGTKKTLALGGDAGYTFIPGARTPKAVGENHVGKVHVVVTLTGKVQADSTEESSQYLKNYPHVTFCESFSPKRSVVERVIGRMQALSDFIVGPVYISQAALLSKFLLFYAGIVNMLLRNNPYLFVSKPEEK